MTPTVGAPTAHARYVAHVEGCEAAEHGRWCRECVALVRDADAEGWRCLPIGYTPEAWAYELRTRREFDLDASDEDGNRWGWAE